MATMELKMFKDTVTTAGQLCDTRLELPIETEVLIPDYLPEVFKIVKSFVYPVVLQKQVQAGRLTVEGYFRVEIFYQGEEKSLCSMEQKVPFSRQVELKNADSGVTEVSVSGEVQYINCRAVNQRRLDIRGAYNLSVRATAALPQEILTAVSGMGVQQKLMPLDTVGILLSPEKQFTLEEEISFEGQPLGVLHTQNVVHVQEVKLVSGRAVVKGEVAATVTYRNEEGLQHAEQTLEFNQIIELEGVTEDCECQVALTPIGCTISAGEENGGYQISVTCILAVKAMKQLQYLAVCDGFSTQYEVACTRKEIGTELLLDHLTNTVETEAQGKLPDAAAKVLDCYATCFTPELTQAEGENSVSIHGRAIAHLICVNALEEIECYDKVCEYTLPKKYNVPLQEIDASLTAQCVNIRAVKNGEEAAAELDIMVKGVLLQKKKVSVVEELSCGEELEKENDVALRVYYADAGEAVFDIAKRYHASPADVAALAGIETDTLDEAQRLLIPMTE